jgi:phosphoribosyl-dephospho-CoA transferase
MGMAKHQSQIYNNRDQDTLVQAIPIPSKKLAKKGKNILTHSRTLTQTSDIEMIDASVPSISRKKMGGHAVNTNSQS